MNFIKLQSTDNGPLHSIYIVNDKIQDYILKKRTKITDSH